MKKLNAKNYLNSIKDSTKLKRKIILTPHQWLAADLTNKKFNSWPSSGAQVAHERAYDLVVCLPGASMAMITMEEAIASGAREFLYLGTGAGLRSQASGSLLKNSKIISVLNPFTEQDDINWQEIKRKKIEIVDMEVAYLKSLAKKRKVKFNYWLIVADRVSRNDWTPLKLNAAYKSRYKMAINTIKSEL